MPRTQLPVVSCEGCGACCRHIGTPPGFAAFFPSPGHLIPEEWKQWPDYGYFLAAPESARQQLADYYAAVDRGEVTDRSAYDCPCLWFDLESGRCRHYEYRPEVCREFEVGGEECLRLREEVNHARPT
jgi:uncharacterized protein